MQVNCSAPPSERRVFGKKALEFLAFEIRRLTQDKGDDTGLERGIDPRLLAVPAHGVPPSIPMRRSFSASPARMWCSR